MMPIAPIEQRDNLARCSRIRDHCKEVVRALAPWGMAFLPDGRMLVTQKGGTMLIVSADGSRVQANLGGVPPVDSAGQGGQLDVALDPAFDPVTNSWVCWSYSEAGTGGSGTAVTRGRLIRVRRRAS